MKELLVPPIKKRKLKKTYRKFEMFSLNKLRPVSAELTETGCMMALHYCADHREDPDRKRCKREGLAERGGGASGGGVGGGGANCHQRKESV